MVNKLFVSVIFFLMFLFSCKENLQNKDRSTNQNNFIKRFNDLKESKIDSLMLDKKDSIKSKYLLPETPIITNKHYNKDIAQNNYIYVDSNYVFYPSDVLKITDKYILLLLKKDIEVRAATFKINGEPIETILISDTAGNNEWKAIRSFSSVEDHKYDPVKNEFIFTDSRIDTEWIIFPTSGKDIISYKKESKVGVKSNGRFFLKSQKDLN